LLSSVILTRREREILRLNLAGRPPKHIAWVLELSVKTVNQRLQQMAVKVGAAGREELHVWAMQHPTCTDPGVACEFGLHPLGCHCPAPYCLWMSRHAAPHPPGCRCKAPDCPAMLSAA
jgi:DNA-binding CsgD family transcriptional regulator